ncbi:MAG: hypothetical protein H6855_03000 [Rhodospirillales bacterium]|nr:hypothetical protein [Rhodospirillales bacterium]MCB9965034.1 hypothetical protein [Rhodospirillales bacterium]MCB9980362.1 hypothetical protein [Rhodospirillales bacterium]
MSKNPESGNVLFLILIAVALFAALSYAVMSSTNTGGGDANDESNLVNSAAVTQYPASIKTAIIRQSVSKGVATPTASSDLAAGASGFLFDKPPFTGIATADEYRVVFHPRGGSASYVQAINGVLTSGATGDWLFNMDFEVVNIGSTANGIDGNEIIAFLPDLTSSICSRINTELGISSTPTLASAVTIADNLEQGDTISTANPAANALGTTLNATLAALDGKPYGCFRNGSAGPYTYYHVLLER